MYVGNFNAVTELYMCSRCSHCRLSTPRTSLPRTDANGKAALFSNASDQVVIISALTPRRQIATVHTDESACHVMSANRSYLPQCCSSVSPLLLCVPSPSIKFESRVKHVLHNFVIPWLERPQPIRNFLQMEGRETPSHRYWSLATKT